MRIGATRDMICIDDPNICLHQLHGLYNIRLPSMEVLQKKLKDPTKVFDWEKSLVAYLEQSEDLIFAEEILLELAQFHLEHGNIQAASILLQINSIQYPDSIPTWIALAETQLKLNNKTAALQYYGEILEYEPKNCEVLFEIQALSRQIKTGEYNDKLPI